MQPLQSKKAEITKSKILTAAEEEFCDKGFFGARIDEIAERAGVNKRMIYEHFGNKDGLYESVLISVYERIAEYERSLMIDDLEPVLALKHIINKYFSFLEANPSFVRMLMWENLNNARAIRGDKAKDLKNPIFNYIRTQIKRGKESGVFKKDADEHQIVVSTMNFVFSYFSNIHTLSALFDRDMNSPAEIIRRADFVSNMIIDYLKA
jgi:AcrR family transcriptional regulator